MMDYRKKLEFKERIRLAKRISIENAAKDLRVPNELGKDSLTRIEINQIIEDDLKNGKARLEILIKLNQNPEYSKYNKYFRTWIDNKYTKYLEKNKGKGQDEQERD